MDWSDRYGRWALVTGASSGIGRALALEAAGRGLNLLLAGRRAEALAEAAQAAGDRGVEARTIVADLAATGGCQVVIDACKGIDVGLVVAAAGFGTSGRFADSELADELDMLEVNCRAVLVLAHHFAPRLQARGRGGIILLASLVGWHGTPNAAHYAATKAYNQVLAEGLGRELKASGVDVLSIAPGPVRSGFADRAGMVMGAAEKPETVARAAMSALGRRVTIVPGRLSKLLTYSLALMPRRARIGILGRVMGGMTAHLGQPAA